MGGTGRVAPGCGHRVKEKLRTGDALIGQNSGYCGPAGGVARGETLTEFELVLERQIVTSCLCRVRCRDFVSAKVYAGIVDDKNDL